MRQEACQLARPRNRAYNVRCEPQHIASARICLFVYLEINNEIINQST
jgi:hypothetical protein